MGKLHLFRIKLAHLWILTVIVGIFVFVNTHPIRPNDFWWHIKVGKEILETKTIPIVDKYSYTMNGEPYPSYQMFWLMEVFMYSIFNLGGPALTVFVQSIIITTAYTMIIYIGYLQTGSWRLAAVGGIFAAALGINDWNVRPQSITFLLAGICLWGIYSYRQKKHWMYLFAIPFCMLIWVNSHGTFPIGLVMIGIWFADESWNFIRKRQYDIGIKGRVLVAAAALVISSLVLLFNPRGPGIIGYLTTMGSNPIVQNLVVEWAPPTINSLLGGLFYGALLLVAGLMVFSPRRPDLFDILTFLIFAVLGINTSRGVVWFGLALAPILVKQLHSIVSNRSPSNAKTTAPESPLMNGIIGVLLLLLAIVSLPWFKHTLPLPPAKAGLISSETPVDATEYMVKEQLSPQIFHAMSFGSYLIWAAQPSYKVFVDSRIELYPPELWLDYLSISNAHDDWEIKLQEYGVNTLMLSPDEQASLITKFRQSDEWILAYEDDAAVIYIRKDMGNVKNRLISQGFDQRYSNEFPGVVLGP